MWLNKLAKCGRTGGLPQMLRMARYNLAR